MFASMEQSGRELQGEKGGVKKFDHLQKQPPDPPPPTPVSSPPPPPPPWSTTGDRPPRPREPLDGQNNHQGAATISHPNGDEMVTIKPEEIDLPGDGNTKEKTKKVSENGPENEAENHPNSSPFNNLIMYNAEGKPYIDVNQLIYSPRKKKETTRKEKSSWYFADYLFIICNFLSLIATSHFLAVGIQSMLWDQSVASVSRTDPANGNTNGTILRFKTSSNRADEIMPEELGTTLTLSAICGCINVTLGFYGCLCGCRILLKLHAFLDLFMFLVQLGVSILTIWTGRCDQLDMFGFQEGFEFMVRSYVEPKRTGLEGDEQYYATTLLDEVQISMQCCGASNWTDYLSSRVTQLEHDYQAGRIFDPTKPQRLFPFSCCKAWWVRNLYCADNSHIWTYPGTSRLEVKKFRERIHEVGCAPKVWLSCKRLLFDLGQGLFVWTLFSGILLILESFSIHLQLRALNTAIREIKQQEFSVKRFRGFTNDAHSDHDDDDDDDAKKSSHTFAIGMEEESESNLAPPTEDEIQHVKSRTPFAQFQLRMRHTELGKLLQTARSAMIPDDKYDVPDDSPHLLDSDHEKDKFGMSHHHHAGSKSGHRKLSHLRRSQIYSELEEDIQRVRLEDRKREEELQTRRLEERNRLLAQNSFYYATKKKLEKRRATATNFDLPSFISVPRPSYGAIAPMEEEDESEAPSVKRGSKSKSTTGYQTPQEIKKKVSMGGGERKSSTDYESMAHVNFPLRKKSDDQQPPRRSVHSSGLPVLTKKKKSPQHRSKKRRGTSVGLKLFSSPEGEKQRQQRSDDTTTVQDHHRRRRRRSTGHHRHRRGSKDKSGGGPLHDKPWKEY